MKESVSEVLEKIYKKIKKVEVGGFGIENSFLNSLMLELEEIAFSITKEDFLNNKIFKQISQYYKQWEAFTEIEESIDFLAYGNKSQNFGIQITEKYVLDEIEIAGINSESKLVFIGSGPYPESAIKIAEVTGCMIDCIDREIYAVGISKKIISKLGLNDQISIYFSQGEDINFSGYTHVFLAAHVDDKEEIISKVSKGKTIILRYGEEERGFIYSPLKISSQIFQNLKVTGTIKGNHELIHSSKILTT